MDTPESTAAPAPETTGAPPPPSAPTSDAGAGSQATNSDASSTAASSTATPKGDEPAKESSFDALKRVATASREKAEREAGTAQQAAGSPPAETGSTEKAAPAAEAPPTVENLLGKLPKEEWDALAPKTKKRLNQYRTVLRQHTNAIAQLGPQAKVYGELMQWATQAKLTQEDFSFGLDLMAAVRSDPARAAKALKELNAYVNEQIGEILPDDIAARVTAGEISEAAGKELARAKKDAERARATADEQVQANADRTRLAEATAQTAAITEAVRGYEAQWKATDPDYPRKWPQV